MEEKEKVMIESIVKDILENKVTKEENGCWLYTGALDPEGYPIKMHVGFKQIRIGRLIAHIHLGLDLDNENQLALHKCSSKSCINPEHLYVGDREQNQRDAVQARTHINASKTHCKRGHEFNEQNTYIDRNGYRICKVCQVDKQREKRNTWKFMVNKRKIQ